MITDTVKNELEKIFDNVYGGLYLEINDKNELKYLEEIKKWDGIYLDVADLDKFKSICKYIDLKNSSNLIHIANLNMCRSNIKRLLNEIHSEHVENETKGFWIKHIIITILPKKEIDQEILSMYNDVFYIEHMYIGEHLLIKHRIIENNEY